MESAFWRTDQMIIVEKINNLSEEITLCSVNNFSVLVLAGH